MDNVLEYQGIDQVFQHTHEARIYRVKTGLGGRSAKELLKFRRIFVYRFASWLLLFKY